MSTNGHGALTWHGDSVALKEVQRCLAELREDPEGGVPASLAGVLNLVAVAADGDGAESIDDTVAGLAAHHPSRIIILRRGGGPDDGIDADVSATCGLTGGQRSVCVERVELTLHGRTREGAASVVVPLLRPDLPCFLWWPGVPDTGDPLLRGLSHLCSRVITDVAQGDDGIRGARALASTVALEDVAVTDLAWAAITPWRQLLTQITRPDDIASLASSAAVASLSFAATEPSLKSLLMAGWLRDSLGDKLMIDFQPRPGRTGRIESLTLEGARGLRLTIERIGARPAVALTAERAGHRLVRRVLPLRRPERISLLAGELELQQADPPFERAAATAAMLPVS